MLSAQQLIGVIRHPSNIAHALVRHSPRIALMAGYEDIAWRCVPLSNQGISDLIRITKPESMLEIGVGSGDTLESYLNVAETYTDEVRYIGFDTFSEGPPEDETAHLNRRIQNADNERGFWQMHHTSKGEVQSIPDGYEVECQVQLIEGNTRDTLEETNIDISPVDLVYIDGGHSYDTVQNDFRGIIPMLKHSSTSKNKTVPAGTIVAFDDFNCESGVTEFISELLSENDPGFNELMFVPASQGNSGCITTVLSF